MESVEAEGDSVDAAIQRALTMLRTTRDRVEIEILANASRGLLGFGGRKAKVRATLRRTPSFEPAADLPRASARAARVRPRSSEALADSGFAEHARQALAEITRHIGVKVDVNARSEADHIVLEMTGDTSGVLIGRRGQMLDALEYIVNRIVARDEDAAGRIVVDSQDYRRRRREALEDLARRMGAQAKKKQKPVALNPMSPRDRRTVHLILQEDPSLTTRSSGKGYFRKLIIFPEGARRARGEA